MKPGEETPQNWQKPVENLSQSPYQAPFEPQTPPLEEAQPMREPVALQLVQPEFTSEPLSPEPVEPQAEPAFVQPEQLDDAAAQPSQPDTGEQNDANDDRALLRWQANEYIHHERTSVWYAVLAVVVVALIALAIFVFHSITFAILIPVMLVALVVYVRRPPSVLDYTLSRKGLHVNDHLYLYDQFRAFGVVTHDGTHSVVLLPRKRFQVSQTVYFPEDVGESLVDMFATRLPMQEVKLDAVDKLLKKLRI